VYASVVASVFSLVLLLPATLILLAFRYVRFCLRTGLIKRPKSCKNKVKILYVLKSLMGRILELCCPVVSLSNRRLSDLPSTCRSYLVKGKIFYRKIVLCIRNTTLLLIYVSYCRSLSLKLLKANTIH